MTDVTALLLRWRDDPTAEQALLEAMYDELQRIAASQLANERHVEELQPGTLVSEAYLRLIELKRIEWQDRAHFLAMAARLMREILIDQARKRGAMKRDGGLRVTMTGIKGDSLPSTNVLMIHDALEALTEIDPKRARIVELRFFGGLTIEETATALEISPATVKRNWEVARGWLFKTLEALPAT